MKRPFLYWALTETLFLAALAVARIAYHGHIHIAGKVVIVALLAEFLIVSGACGWLAWREDYRNERVLRDIAEATEATPGLAMLGTVSGFLIALSSSQGDLQHKATGASTALAATFVGIGCWLVLKLQHRMLERHGEA